MAGNHVAVSHHIGHSLLRSFRRHIRNAGDNSGIRIRQVRAFLHVPAVPDIGILHVLPQDTVQEEIRIGNCRIFIAGCLIGGGIELIQGLTDYRSCDIMDFRADATGLVIGSLITLFIYTIGHCKQK